MAESKQSQSRNFTLYITCIRSDGKFLKFWALPENSVDRVKKLERLFSEKSEELEALPFFSLSNQIPPESKCCVRSNIKRQWCRARVRSIDGYYKIVVSLIDYGNIEVVLMENVRKVEEQLFFCYPALAIECILADVVPSYGGEWVSGAVEYCEKHLLFQSLSGFVVTEYQKIPVIRIAKGGESEPFVQRLINKGLASIEAIVPKTELVYNGPCYKFLQLEGNTSHLVSISYVESPHNFFVQLSPVEVELKNLMDAIDRWVRVEYLDNLKDPIIGTPCLTKFRSQKFHYYRAIVKDVQLQNCSVMFVDYGYSVTTSFLDLKVLPIHFLALPAQAIRCTLQDGISVDTKTFVEATNRKYLTCHVIFPRRDAYVVTLLHNGEDALMQHFTELRQSEPACLFYTVLRLTIGSSLDVSISYLYNPREFFCHLVQNKEQLDSISGMLSSVNDFDLPEFYDMIPGYPVCVKYSEDELWYRAKIIAARDLDNIEVLFVDYGNTENVALQNIRKITSDLLKFPIQAFKLTLLGLPVGEIPMTDEVVDQFDMLTLEKTLVAEIVSFSKEKGYEVVLFDPQLSQTSINEKITFKAVIPTNILPNVSQVEDLYVTCFTSPSLFFGQLSKFDLHKLNELQEEIGAFYSTAANKGFKPSIGDIVCARFSEDGLYYRAKVESATTLDYNVFFTDYGNRELVKCKDIHELHRKFTQHPSFGIECALEKYPQEVNADELENLMLEREIQVTMIKEVNGKWFVSLKESFAGNVAILDCLRGHKRDALQKNLSLQSSITYFDDRKKLEYNENWVHHDDGSNKKNSTENYYDQKDNNKDGDASRRHVETKSITPSHYSEQNFIDSTSYKKDTVEVLKEVKTEYGPKYKLSSNQLPPHQDLDDYDCIVVPNGSYRDVYVSHVVSPSEFYCQIVTDSSELQTLMDNISKMYDCLKPNEMKLEKNQSGSPCCAIYEEDGAWYRAKIKSFTPNVDDCKVEFVDYGNSENVLVTNLKSLHSDFYGLPPQALQCSLYNTLPDGGSWKGEDIRAFTEMTNEKSFVAQFVKTEPNGVHLVNLLNINKLQDDILNKEFVNMGHGHLEDSNKLFVVPSLVASTSLTFSEPAIELGHTKDVFVTWVTDAVQFFCQIESHNLSFKAMMEKIQDHYGKETESDGIVDRPHSGMICVAQFPEDSAWYRARIQDVKKNVISVYYVDYGNTRVVEKKQVKYILQDFTVLPVQAVKCHLRGIKPSKKPILSQFVPEFFDGKAKCKFIAYKEDFFMVDFSCNGKDIATEMIKIQLAVPDQDTTLAGLDNASQELPHIPRNIPNVEKAQLINVIVSFVESPKKFFCQFQDYSDQLDQLMTAIESHYTALDISQLKPAFAAVGTSGSSCIAKYSEDSVWYRAVINSHPSPNQLEVLFVDYGNSEITDNSQVTSILPKFAELPAQAIECQLHNAPSTCTDEFIDKFQQLTENASELMAKIEKVQDKTLIVSLFDVSDPDVEVNLLESVFGVPSEENCSEEGENLTAFLPLEVPTIEKLGYVSAIKNPHDFYVQLADREDDLTELSSQLSEKYHNIENNFTGDVTVGLACCAQFSEDGEWYRAVVTDVQGDSTVVLFVDYGNIDTVSKSSLKAIEADFLLLPPFAFPCRLAGVCPVEEMNHWSEISINTFNEITDGELVTVKFLCQSLPASVCITKDKINVADKLISMQLAGELNELQSSVSVQYPSVTTSYEATISSLHLTYPERDFPTSKFTVKVCFVDSLDKFFVTDVEWGEEFESLTATLESIYDNTTYDSSLCLEQVKVFQPCVAKYSVDEAWYRAIVSDINENSISVSFVDYGNSEITELKALRQLTSELLNVPPFAVECSLLDVTPIKGKEDEISAKLQQLLDDEVEIELEVVNSQKPCKVKLKNETDFVSQLVNEGLALYEVSSSERLRDSERFKENLRIAFVEDPIEELKKNTIISQTISSDKIIGFLKHSEILNGHITLYIVPFDLEDLLAEQQDRLQIVYNENTSKLETIKENMFCSAKFSDDECWYRAQVLKKYDHTVLVRFVDYGNHETVDISDINELMPDFLQMPQYCIKCCLFGSMVIDDNEERVQKRLEAIEDELELLVCNILPLDSEVCIQKLTLNRLNIVELMIDEELMRQVFPLHYCFKEEFDCKIEQVKIEENLQLYIFPLKWTEKRDLFQKELQKECESNISLEYFPITSNRLYATKKSNQWFRVAVLQCDVVSATVIFVDFGIDCNVDCSSLQKLLPDFHHQPPFSLKCSLLELDHPVNEVHEKLNDIITEKVVTCKVLNVPNNSEPFKVKLYVDGIDVLNQLNSQAGYNNGENSLVESGCSEEITKSGFSNKVGKEVISPNIDIESNITKDSKDESDMNVVIKASDILANDVSTARSLVEGEMSNMELDDLSELNECFEVDKLAVCEQYSRDSEALHDKHSELNEDLKTDRKGHVTAQLDEPKQTEFDEQLVTIKNEVESVCSECVMVGSNDITQKSEEQVEYNFCSTQDTGIESYEGEVKFQQECQDFAILLENQSDDVNEKNVEAESKEHVTAELNEPKQTEFYEQQGLDKNETESVFNECVKVGSNENITQIPTEHDKHNFHDQDTGSEVYDHESEAEFQLENQDSEILLENQSDDVKEKISDSDSEDHATAELYEPKQVEFDEQQVTNENEVEPVFSKCVMVGSNENITQKSEGQEEYNFCSSQDTGIKSYESEVEFQQMSQVFSILLENQSDDVNEKNVEAESKEHVTSELNEPDQTEFEQRGQNKNETESAFNDCVIVGSNENITQISTEQDKNNFHKQDTGSEVYDHENEAEFQLKNQDSEILLENQSDDVNEKISDSDSEDHATVELDEPKQVEFDEQQITNENEVEPAFSKCVIVCSNENITQKSEKQDEYNFCSSQDSAILLENQCDDVNEKNVKVEGKDLGSSELNEPKQTEFDEQQGQNKNETESTFNECMMISSNENINENSTEQNEFHFCCSQNVSDAYDGKIEYQQESQDSAILLESHSDWISEENKDVDSFDHVDTQWDMQKQIVFDASIKSSVQNSEPKKILKSKKFNEIQFDCCKNAKDIENEIVTDDLCTNQISECQDRQFPLGKNEVFISEVVISGGSILMAATPLALKDNLVQLQNNLKDYFAAESISQPLSFVESGLYAILSKDQAWYRGKILDVSENVLTVLYLDYGRTEIVNLIEVRELPHEFCVDPPYAVWCTLPSVKCNETETVKNFLKDHLQNENVILDVLNKEEPYKVKLLIDGQDVVPQLFSDNLLSLEFVEQCIQPGKYLVYPLSINHDSESVEFYVCVSRQFDNLKYLGEKLLVKYQNMSDSVPLDHISKSGLYVVNYESAWYRCSVLDISCKTVSVKLVDIGKCLKLKDISLYPLLTEFCLEPSFAIPCCLPNFKIPDGKSKEFLAALQEVNIKKELFVIFHEKLDNGRYFVSLTNESGDLLEQFKNKGILCSLSPEFSNSFEVSLPDNAINLGFSDGNREDLLHLETTTLLAQNDFDKKLIADDCSVVTHQNSDQPRAVAAKETNKAFESEQLKTNEEIVAFLNESYTSNTTDLICADHNENST